MSCRLEYSLEKKRVEDGSPQTHLCGKKCDFSWALMGMLWMVAKRVTAGHHVGNCPPTHPWQWVINHSDLFR